MNEVEENESTSLFNTIYKKRKVSNDEEITRYLDLPQEYSKTDLTNWWNCNKSSFPNLYKFALDILSIPATRFFPNQVMS